MLPRDAIELGAELGEDLALTRVGCRGGVLVELVPEQQHRAACLCPRRTSARTNVTLTRAFHLIKFDLTINAEGPPVRAGGRVDGDSVLILGIASGTDKADSQRVALHGPILLPTLVPLAVSLTERPKLGKHYVFPVFDPASMTLPVFTTGLAAEGAIERLPGISA